MSILRLLSSTNEPPPFEAVQSYRRIAELLRGACCSQPSWPETVVPRDQRPEQELAFKLDRSGGVAPACKGLAIHPGDVLPDNGPYCLVRSQST